MTPANEEPVPRRREGGVVEERAPVYGWARRTVYGGGGVTGRVARGALAPLSWVWGIAAERRLSSPKAGESLSAPAISVGNVTVGGGGKTSLVEWLVREGVPAGTRVAVLARGYGRRDETPRALAPAPGQVSTAEVGDEAPLLARAGAWVGVSPNRFLAARAVEALGTRPDVFVLDDGLQHRAVPRALDLVVFGAADLEAPARCIPAGPLRQRPGWRPPRVAWVVAGGEPRERSWPRGSIGRAYGGWWRELPGTPADWRIRPTVTLAAWRAGGPEPFEPAGRRVVAFAGVARPDSVAVAARAAGYGVAALVAFPDHHSYEAGEIAALRASHPGAAFVTTEKDAVKCDPAWFGEAPVGVLSRRLQPRDPELLRRLVAEAMGRQP